MSVSNEWERKPKEAAVAYFKALSGYFPGDGTAEDIQQALSEDGRYRGRDWTGYFWIQIRSFAATVNLLGTENEQ